MKDAKGIQKCPELLIQLMKTCNTPHMLNESKIHEQVVTNTTNIK